MNPRSSSIENMSGNFSVISSAWFMLLYSDGDMQARLAKALMQAVKLANEQLSRDQQELFQRLGADRIRDLNYTQMQQLVESLDETRIHQLAETIAQLYFLTVRPYET